MTWRYLRDGAVLALASVVFCSAFAPTPPALAQDTSQSPTEVFKEIESVLNELVRHMSTSNRNLSEESFSNFRSTAAQLSGLVDSLERHLMAHQDSEDAPSLRERISDLREFAKLAATPDRRDLFLTSEVDTRAKIISKPAPALTEENVRANTSGRVRLLVILRPEGSVEHVVTLESVGYGLTEKSVEAARKIRFEPALKGGRAVAQVLVLEYHFYM